MPIFAIGMYLLSFIKQNSIYYFYGILIAIFLSLSHGAIKGEYISKQTRENYVVENINKKNINTAVVSPISQDTWYEAFGIVYGFMAVNVPIIEQSNTFYHHKYWFCIVAVIIFYMFVRFPDV
jgi:hypothetical protein